MNKAEFEKEMLKDLTLFQLGSLIFWYLFNRKRVDKFVELRTDGYSAFAAFKNCKK